MDHEDRDSTDPRNLGGDAGVRGFERKWAQPRARDTLVLMPLASSVISLLHAHRASGDFYAKWVLHRTLN